MNNICCIFEQEANIKQTVMTVLNAILKHMKDNNLKSANGINLCQVIIDNDCKVGDQVKPLIASFKRHKQSILKDTIINH